MKQKTKLAAATDTAPNRTPGLRSTYAPSSRLLLGFLLAATLLLGSSCERSERSEPVLTGDPHAAHASVNRSKLTVEFSAALDQTQQPIPEQFTVEVDGEPVIVESVTVEENTVGLRLRDKISHDNQVQLSFVNTDTADIQLLAVDQTSINDFAGLGATNTTTNRLWYLLTLGIVPFTLFIFFGAQIYATHE